MAEVSVGGLVDGMEVTSRHVLTRTGRQTMTKTILVNHPHGESSAPVFPPCYAEAPLLEIFSFWKASAYLLLTLPVLF